MTSKSKGVTNLRTVFSAPEPKHSQLIEKKNILTLNATIGSSTGHDQLLHQVWWTWQKRSQVIDREITFFQYR